MSDDSDEAIAGTAREIADLVKDKDLTVAVAESLTGGALLLEGAR